MLRGRAFMFIVHYGKHAMSTHLASVLLVRIIFFYYFDRSIYLVYYVYVSLASLSPDQTEGEP